MKKYKLLTSALLLANRFLMGDLTVYASSNSAYDEELRKLQESIADLIQQEAASSSDAIDIVTVMFNKNRGRGFEWRRENQISTSNKVLWDHLEKRPGRHGKGPHHHHGKHKGPKEPGDKNWRPDDGGRPRPPHDHPRPPRPPRPTGSGDEAMDYSQARHHAFILGTMDITKYKDLNKKKDNAFKIHTGITAPFNDDILWGWVLSATNQKIRHQEHKTNHERLGIGFMMDITLSNDWLLSSSLRVSNGDSKTSWNLFEKLVSSPENSIFKGKQKTNRVHFDHNLSYKVAISDTINLIPEIGLNFLRQFSSDYYAFNNVDDCIIIDNKPHSSISGELALSAEKILVDNNDFLVLGTVSSGISSELYDYVKDTRVSLRSANGAVNSVTIKDDKNKQVSLKLGAMFGLASSSGLYDTSLGYNYSKAKKSTNHQGQLQLKINF